MRLTEPFDDMSRRKLAQWRGECKDRAIEDGWTVSAIAREVNTSPQNMSNLLASGARSGAGMRLDDWFLEHYGEDPNSGEPPSMTEMHMRSFADQLAALGDYCTRQSVPVIRRVRFSQTRLKEVLAELDLFEDRVKELSHCDAHKE